MGTVPENFHGVKGKSGRKSTKDEFAKNQAIKKAWEKVNAELDGKGVEKIALPIALKDMAKEVKLSGDELAPILVKFIDGKETEDNLDTDGVQETL